MLGEIHLQLVGLAGVERAWCPGYIDDPPFLFHPPLFFHSLSFSFAQDHKNTTKFYCKPLGEEDEGNSKETNIYTPKRSKRTQHVVSQVNQDAERAPQFRQD